MSSRLAYERRPLAYRSIHLTILVGLLGLYGVSSYETEYENWEGACVVAVVSVLVFVPLMVYL